MTYKGLEGNKGNIFGASNWFSAVSQILFRRSYSMIDIYAKTCNQIAQAF